jgi:hypothetical protein
VRVLYTTNICTITSNYVQKFLNYSKKLYNLPLGEMLSDCFIPIIKPFLIHWSWLRSYRLLELELWFTAGVTGRQGILTPPGHLISPLVYPQICISIRTYEIDDCYLFMQFINMLSFSKKTDGLLWNNHCSAMLCKNGKISPFITNMQQAMVNYNLLVYGEI